MDPIDKAFEDIVPGTTRNRSDKALKRARTVVEADLPDHTEFDDLEAWDIDPQIMMVKGKPVEMFTIKALAKAWDARTVYSVRKLERAGVLPKARYRKPKQGDQRGNRLYTREQIEAVVRIARECGVYSTGTRVNIVSTGFTEKLAAVWNDL
jgi:hypothetical protein